MRMITVGQVWRVKYTLAKIRTAARELLTLEEKDPRRLFEGNALLRRLVRTGVLAEDKMKVRLTAQDITIIKLNLTPSSTTSWP